MIVRELITRFGFQVDSAKVKQYDKTVDRIRHNADRAADSFRNMLFIGASAFGLSKLATVGDTVQSLEARIAQLPQTVGESGEAFDYLAQRAINARQPLESYMTLYSRIGHATKDLIADQEGLADIVTTISQSFVVGGNAASEQGAAMLQLSQAFNKGKLDGDEFRSVMENMPGQVTDALAKAMGYINKGGLMEASAAGLLTIDKLVKGLQQIAPEVERQFMAMPMTISQAGTIISNRFMRFISRMNRESSAVSQIATAFLNVFDTIESGLYKLVDFLGGASNTIKVFGIALAAALAPMVINNFVGAIALLISRTGFLWMGLVALGVVLEDVYQYFKGGASVTGEIVAAFKNGELWAQALAATLTTLGAAILLFAANSLKAATIAVTAGLRMAAGWAIGLAPILAIPAALTAVVAGVYYLWNNWDTVTQWITKAGEWIVSIYNKIPGAIREPISQFLEWYVGTWKAAIDAVVSFASLISDTYNKVIDAVSNKISSLISKAQGIKDWFVDLLPKGMSVSQSFATPVNVGRSVGANVSNNNKSIVINQTLPAGTSVEVAKAAKDATYQAARGIDNNAMARQLGQAQ